MFGKGPWIDAQLVCTVSVFLMFCLIFSNGDVPVCESYFKYTGRWRGDHFQKTIHKLLYAWAFEKGLLTEQRVDFNYSLL